MSIRTESDRINELTERIIGAAIEVHRFLGPGFLESVYEEAMCRELAERDLHFERQRKVAVRYKGAVVGEARIDLLVGGEIVVELKAIDAIGATQIAQAISYLRALDLRVALIINFDVAVLHTGIKRVLGSPRPPQNSSDLRPSAPPRKIQV